MNEQELNIVVEHYDNDELAAANEALANAYFSFRGECEQAVAENAKLRELVKRMYAAFRRVFPDGHRLDFEQDMRELGIEVTR